MGFNKSWSLSLNSGCHSYGGLQLKNIGAESLIHKLCSIYHLLYKEDTSKAILLIFRRYQHVSGIFHPVLECPHHSTNYVNSIWRNNLIRLFFQYQVIITIPITNVQKPQRINDTFLIDGVLPYLSSITLRRQINACQSFLKVIFLSNISSININHIIDCVLREDSAKLPQLHFNDHNKFSNASTWKI